MSEQWGGRGGEVRDWEVKDECQEKMWWGGVFGGRIYGKKRKGEEAGREKRKLVQVWDKEEWEREERRERGREGELIDGVEGVLKMWKAIRRGESDAETENNKVLRRRVFYQSFKVTVTWLYWDHTEGIWILHRWGWVLIVSQRQHLRISRGCEEIDMSGSYLCGVKIKAL